MGSHIFERLQGAQLDARGAPGAQSHNQDSACGGIGSPGREDARELDLSARAFALHRLFEDVVRGEISLAGESERRIALERPRARAIEDFTKQIVVRVFAAAAREKLGALCACTLDTYRIRPTVEQNGIGLERFFDAFELREAIADVILSVVGFLARAEIAHDASELCERLFEAFVDQVLASFEVELPR